MALVERLLDEIDAATVDHDWATVRARVLIVLAIDPENADPLVRSLLQNAANKAHRLLHQFLHLHRLQVVG